MKKKPITKEFNVTIEDKNYTLSITKVENTKLMPNCHIYSCMTFDEEMVPFKRFTLVYNFFERSYWAWTGDVIRKKDRLFRNKIADLLNDGTLKLTS